MEGGRETLKCLGSEEGIRRGMGMAESRQSPENALKKRRHTPACHSCRLSFSLSLFFLFVFMSLFSKDENPVCSRCSLNKLSVNKGDYLPMSDQTGFCGRDADQLRYLFGNIPVPSTSIFSGDFRCFCKKSLKFMINSNIRVEDKQKDFITLPRKSVHTPRASTTSAFYRDFK